MKKYLGLMIAMGALMSLPQIAFGRAHRVTQVPNNEWACGVCHVSEYGAGPRTNFGEDVNSGLDGNNVDWSALCPLDSDGDGHTNGAELGDPNCAWNIGDENPAGGALSNPADVNSIPEEMMPMGGEAMGGEAMGGEAMGGEAMGGEAMGGDDAGGDDAGADDAGADDAGADAGGADAGGADAGGADAGGADAGGADAGGADAGGADAGGNDSGSNGSSDDGCQSVDARSHAPLLFMMIGLPLMIRRRKEV